MKKLLFTLTFLSHWAFCAQAPVVPSSTSLNEHWATAVKAVGAGHFTEACAPLDGISRQVWDTPLGEKATALLVESYLQAKNPKKALWVAKRFLDSKPASPYRDRVQLVVALLKIQDHNVYAGVEDMLAIREYTKNSNTRTRAKDALLQVLASSLLSSGELQNLLERAGTDKDILSYIHLQLGREYQGENRWKAARHEYGIVVRSNSGTPVATSAQQGLDALDGRGNGSPSVVVLAPLSGDFAEFGNRMVQGVVLAHEEFTERNGKKILLQIIDDRADPVRAIHRIQDVIELDDVVGIIGPMTSQGATVVSAWLSKAHPEITLITPTATDEGIASLGPNIFQLNVPTARLARSIAEYAVNCMGAHDFAILTPVSDYGHIMTDEFSRAVEALGAQVLTVQQYQEGGTDFKTEFNRIRASKLALDNRRRNISKGLDDASAFNPRDRKNYLDDSLISFDAVFIASSDPSDAASMASHVAFNKLGGKLLGSSGWYGRALLADGKHLVDGAHLSVPFAENSDDAGFAKFAKSFSARWDGAQPDKERVSGLSYDGMRIFLEFWLNKGSDNAKAILQKKTIAGVYGTYQFDSAGANAAQHVMTVSKGKFVLSDNCSDK